MRARQRLTKGVVEGVPPRPGTSVYVGDSEVPGFRVRVSTWRGRVRRAYVYSYTPRGAGSGAAQRHVTIGEHGEPWTNPRTGEGGTLTTARARDEALWLRGLRNAGGDPKTAYRRVVVAVSACPTVRAFSADYLEKHADLHKGELTASFDRGNLKNHILDLKTRRGKQAVLLGDLPLDEVGPEHVADLMAALRAIPVTANRCRALVSHMFTVARRWRVIPRSYVNPCQDTPRFKEGRRKRFLLPDELPRVGTAMRAAEVARPVAVAALRVILFTGARPREILSLKDTPEELQLWKETLTDGTVIERGRAVRKTKRGDVAGERVILLPPEAVAEIRRSPRRPGNPYVFPSPRRPHHLGYHAWRAVWVEIAKAAGVEGVVPYSATRHTFGGTSAGLGQSLRVFGEVMGHANAATTQRYAHVGPDPQRRASDETAAALASALKGKDEG